MQEIKPHILIVDDDSRILKLLKKFLQQNNFLVSTAIDVSAAKELLQYYVYDLIILDVMLPNVTGIDFARSIKKVDTIPIVMLTALSSPEHKISGLEAGASDYITKPFEPQELLIRIRNLIALYRHHKSEENIKHFGSDHYNCKTKEFVKNGVAQFLTGVEQTLLEILIAANGATLSRDELSMQMGGLSPRSIDVQIARIRNKIEDNPKKPIYLRTVRNTGYALYI